MQLRPVSLATLIVMGAFASSAMAQSRSTYIVQLAGEPTASYSGNVAGFAATRPAPGARLNSRAPAVQAYAAYLDAQQLSVASVVSNAPILARYQHVYNGFAASLTDAEVRALRANPKVISVQPDEMRQMDTTTTSAFLGLSAPGGAWSKFVNGKALQGEDIIIGVIDGGVWPESLSYADQVDANGAPVHSGGTLAYGPPPAGWSGTCMAGEGFTPAIHCNNKLIGARFFNKGFLENRPLTGTGSKHWTEFYSPRDSVAGPSGHGGHGSHTSSTAGGNAKTPTSVSGLNLGPASGMAPRARIAAYKVCYTQVNPAATDGTGTSNGCFSSDSVEAIDKAVADGVHVINFSISGSQTSVNDPVEQAFLRAATAGVFVAVSAGNAGPAVAVAHISPWLTTVAASSHSRNLSGNVTLGNGAVYTGASVNLVPLSAKPMINSVDAKASTASVSDANLCFLNSGGLPTLDPAKTAGKVVVCTRGTNARVEKSLTVANAGGLGMVLADNGAGLVAEAHAVPTVHVNLADGALIKAYAATAGSTAAIGAYFNGVKPAPIMAGFSSRGPNQGDANMLKPDLTAPGVDVIAALTPGLTQAERDAVAAGTLVPPTQWASLQGTSMASPHVAGLAALIRQAHPTWSPAAIKSALMTTTSSTLNDGLAGAQNGLLPWAQGAGHVNPNLALDPGLVYDAGPIDYTHYQCKVNPVAVAAGDCATYGTLNQTYNFNLPSITVGSVTGTTVVTRRVTNVGASPATYTAAASIPGFTAVVSPATLTLAPGETKSFTVSLASAGAVDGVWSFGSLVWSDGVHTVRSPLTARLGKTIVAPASLTGTTTSGTRLITVNTAFSGRMTASKGGMKPVTVGPQVSLKPAVTTAAQLRTTCAAGADTASVKVYPFSIAANTIVARFELRNADVGTAGDDNDMGILAPDGSFIYSGNDGSNEAVQLASPATGAYRVCVVAYGGAATMTHKLSSWLVTTADASSTLNVMVPGSVVAGGTATVGVAWRDLALDGRYVGGFRLHDTTGLPQSTTVVRVNTNGMTPTADVPSVTKAK